MLTMDPIPKKQSLTDLYGIWSKAGISTNMTPMLDNLSSDIDKAVYAYAGMNAGPAVRSRAKLLTVKAIKNYDPKSASSLRSWVYTQLQPLSRYSRELNPSPMPERAYQQISAIKRQEADFYENKGRSPSDGELADILGMSFSQLNKLRGYDKKTYSENFAAFTGANPVTAQELTATQNDKFKQDVLDTMYGTATPYEQLIMEHKLGFNNKKVMANGDLAKKLKMSPGRVSQLTANLSKKLEEYVAINKRSQ